MLHTIPDYDTDQLILRDEVIDIQPKDDIWRDGWNRICEKPKWWMWMSPLLEAPLYSDWVEFCNSPWWQLEMKISWKNPHSGLILDDSEVKKMEIRTVDELSRLDPFIYAAEHGDRLNYNDFISEYDGLYIWKTPKGNPWEWLRYFRWWDVESQVIFRATKLKVIDSIVITPECSDSNRRINKILHNI